jgi:hypothetical protein
MFAEQFFPECRLICMIPPYYCGAIDLLFIMVIVIAILGVFIILHELRKDKHGKTKK